MPERVDRATWLRCRAANAFNLAACYQEEAENLLDEARAADPDSDWPGMDIFNQNTADLPEDWLSIAEWPTPDGPGDEGVGDAD